MKTAISSVELRILSQYDFPFFSLSQILCFLIDFPFFYSPKTRVFVCVSPNPSCLHLNLSYSLSEFKTKTK